jgi:hypothetical protein
LARLRKEKRCKLNIGGETLRKRALVWLRGWDDNIKMDFVKEFIKVGWNWLSVVFIVKILYKRY